MTTIKMCTHGNCDAAANLLLVKFCDTHFCSPEHGGSGGEALPKRVLEVQGRR
jgi:hypothetical protein